MEGGFARDRRGREEEHLLRPEHPGRRGEAGREECQAGRPVHPRARDLHRHHPGLRDHRRHRPLRQDCSLGSGGGDSYQELHDRPSRAGRAGRREGQAGTDGPERLQRGAGQGLPRERSQEGGREHPLGVEHRRPQEAALPSAHRQFQLLPSSVHAPDGRAVPTLQPLSSPGVSCPGGRPLHARADQGADGTQADAVPGDAQRSDPFGIAAGRTYVHPAVVLPNGR